MDRLGIAEKLIAINSTSGTAGQVEAADFVSNVCHDLGFEVRQFPYHTDKGDAVNVVVSRGGENPVLALSGHMDTVPVKSVRRGESTKYPDWKTDPYKLTQVDERLFGRGVADMKSFLAIAIEAAASVPLQEFDRPVAIYFTCDEEVGCVGAKNLLANPDFQIAPNIVIGEPTDLKPVILHKGYAYFRIRLSSLAAHTRSAHSSDDRNCTNLVEVFLPVVLGVVSEFKEQLRRITDNRFSGTTSPNYPTMNVGNVILPSSAAKNVIPTELVLECDLRNVPGQDASDVLDLLEQLLRKSIEAIKGHAGEVFVVEVTPARAPTPPMACPAEAQLCQSLCRLTGQQPIDVSFNTEGGLFSRAGAKTVICGPGSIKQAHVDNEYILADWFNEATLNVYIQLIREFCCKEAKL